ncbi:MAG TPA: DUF454 family protein [Candidatus Paceibacterota bacterium]|nr:DUF454 family protein [Candidatus Paceibacterota bacterium]
MRGHIRHIAAIVIALILIIVGVAGLVLPLLPGILFIVVGLLLISAYNPRFDYWLHEQTKKYPLLHRAVLDLQAFIERIIGKR